MAIDGIKSKRQEKKWEVEEELCDIISSIFKKWAHIFSNIKEKTQLRDLLLENILSCDKATLKKKSCTCLGTLSLILSKEEILSTCKVLLVEVQKQ
jgi:hypothetical protein